MTTWQSKTFKYGTTSTVQFIFFFNHKYSKNKPSTKNLMYSLKIFSIPEKKMSVLSNISTFWIGWKIRKMVITGLRSLMKRKKLRWKSVKILKTMRKSEAVFLVRIASKGRLRLLMANKYWWKIMLCSVLKLSESTFLQNLCWTRPQKGWTTWPRPSTVLVVWTIYLLRRAMLPYWSLSSRHCWTENVDIINKLINIIAKHNWYRTSGVIPILIFFFLLLHFFRFRSCWLFGFLTLISRLWRFVIFFKLRMFELHMLSHRPFSSIGFTASRHRTYIISLYFAGAAPDSFPIFFRIRPFLFLVICYGISELFLLVKRRPQLFVQLTILLLEFLDLGGIELIGLLVVCLEFCDGYYLPFIFLLGLRWTRISWMVFAVSSNHLKTWWRFH